MRKWTCRREPWEWGWMMWGKICNDSQGSKKNALLQSFFFTCLLTFLPRACSVIWIEYVYRLDKVTLRALGSLQSSSLRLNYLWSCVKREIWKLLDNLEALMVKVSMALYWKFILQRNIIKCNKRIFRFQDKPRGGGRDSAYERGGDGRRKFWIKPLKGTDLGFFLPL